MRRCGAISDGFGIILLSPIGLSRAAVWVLHVVGVSGLEGGLFVVEGWFVGFVAFRGGWLASLARGGVELDLPIVTAIVVTTVV